MKIEKIEREVLARLEENKLLKDIEGVVYDYKELLGLFPSKEHYWKAAIEYLYFNYQYTEPLDWEE